MNQKIVHWYLNVPKGETCFFHEACLEHDKDYREGKLTKGEADTKFLVSMTKMAVKKKAPDNQIKQAISYYFWVKNGGYISYYMPKILRRLRGR